MRVITSYSWEQAARRFWSVYFLILIYLKILNWQNKLIWLIKILIMLNNILSVFYQNILNLRYLIKLEVVTDHAISGLLVMLYNRGLSQLNATSFWLEVTFGSVVIIVCLVIVWSYVIYKAVLLLRENNAFLNFF